MAWHGMGIITFTYFLMTPSIPFPGFYGSGLALHFNLINSVLEACCATLTQPDINILWILFDTGTYMGSIHYTDPLGITQ